MQSCYRTAEDTFISVAHQRKYMSQSCIIVLIAINNFYCTQMFETKARCIKTKRLINQMCKQYSSCQQMG